MPIKPSLLKREAFADGQRIIGMIGSLPVTTIPTSNLSACLRVDSSNMITSAGFAVLPADIPRHTAQVLPTGYRGELCA
jgi:hypothetical protein